LPPRVPPQTVDKFDQLLSDGYTVMAAARVCQVSKDWAYNRSKGRRKRDQAKFYANLEDAELPPPVSRSKLGPEAARALEDFEFFRRRFTGRASMPWQVEAANQVLALLESPQKEFVVINCPPGAGKSTLFTHDIPLWLICRNRAIRILIGSRTERQAKMYTGRLMDSLERESPYLATDTEKLQGAADADSTVTKDYGRFKPTTPKVWRREELTVAQPNDVAASDKENTLSAYGKDGGVLGGRFDLSIWDDLVDPKNQGTPDAREELKTWWRKIAMTRCEPGGAVVLQGQRIGPDDLYRFALDMHDVVLDEDGFEVEEADPPKKFRHIIYRAHYEDRCPGVHPRRSPAWPQGCLLDPHRLSWRDLESTRKSDETDFLVGYQQEDVDPSSTLVRKVWVTGGRDEAGVEYPGCWDEFRGLCELPPHLRGDLFSYATVDPSGAKYWALQWWIYHPESEQRFLMDLVREKIPSSGFIDYDIDARELVGLMPAWQERSIRLGWPIRYWIMEANAVQKWLAGNAAGDRFRLQYDAQFVRHYTNSNKIDDKLGVSMLSTLYRQGRVRLPGKQSDGSRIASLKLVDEVTRHPHGATDDQVMAQWFGEWNLHRLYTPQIVDPPRFHRPGWSAQPNYSRPTLVRSA
jgi:hypothetical protein